MEIKELRRDGVFIQTVIGRIDASTAGLFEQKLVGAVAERPACLVLDCTELKYISSAGLRALLLSAKQAALAQTQLVLCSVPDQIRRVFELAGLPSILPMFPTLESALVSRPPKTTPPTPVKGSSP